MKAGRFARALRDRLAAASLHALLIVGLVGLVGVLVPTMSDAAQRKPPRKDDASPQRQGATKPPRKTEAKEDADGGDPAKDQNRQAAERDRLTARIAELRRQIAAGEKSRTGAAAALARAEKALSDVNRRLDAIAQRQKAAQDLVVTLDRQRIGTEGQIAVGQSAIARTLTLLAINREKDPLHTWLVGGNPNDAVLMDADLELVARSEVAGVDALHARVVDLQSRRQRADDDNRALGQQADAQLSAREALASSQAAQRQALEKISQQLTEQRNTAAALEADEKRLSRVVEQLQKLIDQRAAEERARRQALAKKQADQEAAATRKKGSPPVRAPAPRVEPDVDEGPGGGAFAQLRGQLRLPARGAVTGRFGAARGGGGATWKGLFVKTEAGADVHAVAAGKVVYADDLRGFGNLLIIDHGNQYLSIYGNNDALLRRAGDSVAAGDVVSRAGNSSGDDQTGLYFELRFRGRPFDPMPWIGGR